MLTPEAVRQLKSVERAALRMENLIRDLVDTSRIQRDGLVLVTREESVASIVVEAADEVVALASEKGTLLETRPPARDALVRCDRERILQVLGNLLGNALKFTPAGGTVTFGIEPVEEGLRFVVSDTGPGIQPEDAPHIFEPYWTSDRNGTGLGLYIAQGIVRAHESRLEVRTEVGKGTSFSFTLVPAHGPRAEGSRATNPAPMP